MKGFFNKILRIDLSKKLSNMKNYLMKF